MKNRAIALLGFCLLAVVLCSAQDPSNIASITIKQPARSYRMSETIALDVTITNLSKTTIKFEESWRGAWEPEIYDPQDPTGKDLAVPNKQKHAYRGELESMVVTSPLEPGVTVTTRVLLRPMSDTVTHPGTFRVILGKREFVNNVVIRSKPATIAVIP